MLATGARLRPVIPEIGIPGLILILVVALLVFGPKRLPEMGRSLGRGMREFKDSVTGKDTGDEPPALNPPDDEPAAGFCSSCGAPLAAGAQFCASCGTPVTAVANGPSGERQTVSVEPDR